MRDGFIKIAAATPDLHVADCEYNAAEIVNQAKQAAAKGEQGNETSHDMTSCQDRETRS